MWAMAQKEVRKQLVSMEAQYVGHIVLQDYAPNLISVVTIFRWLFRQQKAATRIWPAAGVSDADMAGASCFGKLIQSALEQNDLEQLQSALVAAGSVPYKPSLVFVEKLDTGFLDSGQNSSEKLATATVLTDVSD